MAPTPILHLRWGPAVVPPRCRWMRGVAAW